MRLLKSVVSNMFHTKTGKKAKTGFSLLAGYADRLLTPPCKGAPFIVWGCLFLSLFFGQTTNVWHGGLYDPDNYLYLIQAMDWLNGQGWYDPVQHRLSPPLGVPLHYSHLLSAFYGCLIFLLRPFLSATSAALAVASFVPLFFFALFLFCLRRLTQGFVDKEWGDFSAYIIVFSPYVLSRFLPGYVDHHGLILLLSVASFLFLTQAVARANDFRKAAMAGALLSLSLALSLESLAVVVFFCLCFGLWATVEGGKAAQSGVVFGLSLFIGSVFFLLITRPPEAFFNAEIPVYSIVYIALAAGIALCFFGALLAGKIKSLFMRIAISGGLAVAAGVSFLTCFPELLEGPYGAVNPAIAKLIFANATEAWPVIRKDASLPQQLFPLVTPLLAIGANIFMLARAKSPSRRWQWGFSLFLLSAFLCLSSFYQIRFMIYVHAFGVLPITAMVWYDWTHRPKAGISPKVFRIARLALFLFVGPALALTVKSPQPFVAEPPNEQALQETGMKFLVEKLDDKKGLGSHPRTIINTINDGPELLFWTPHKVLAGPYHMNVEGNLAAHRFFSTPDAAEAKAIAERTGAEAVVVHKSPEHLKIYGGAEKKPFVRQLIEKEIPFWLKPIDLPESSAFLLFDVRLF